MDSQRKKQLLLQVIALDKKRAGKRHKTAVFFSRTRRQLFSCDKSQRSDYSSFFKKTVFHSKVQPKKSSAEFDSVFSKEKQLVSDYISELRRDDADKPFVIFFGFPDYRTSGGGQRSWQMARSFIRFGYHVEYFHQGTIAETDIDAPAQITFPLYLASIDCIFDNLPTDTFFIFEEPSVKYLDILRSAEQKGIPTVYEHIDNWESDLGKGLFVREAYLEFLSRCDCICATCRGLVNKLSESTDKDILYSPNAVDNALYRTDRQYDRPADLVAGRKTLLYFGMLTGVWHNWEIVKQTALACPDCSVNLIGRGTPELFLSDKPDNVHLLGAKRQQELPAYLAHCDFALIPFDDSEISKYVSPLKIFEYIAMQKPVLSTPLDDIIGFPNTVISDKSEDWIKAVNSDMPVADTAEFTAKNCWDARCKQLIDYKDTHKRK